MKRFELSVGRRYNETESIDKKPNRREGLRSGFSWHRPSADESQTKKQNKKNKSKKEKRKKKPSRSQFHRHRQVYGKRKRMADNGLSLLAENRL